jgi:hypothetical protein
MRGLRRSDAQLADKALPVHGADLIERGEKV